MFRWVLAMALAGASLAGAQSPAQAEVRTALEEQAPIPSKPLAFPAPGEAEESVLQHQANESAQAHANHAASRAQAEALAHLPTAAKDARNNLGTAGQSAAGQATAEEAKKYRGKPPRPLPGGPPKP